MKLLRFYIQAGDRISPYRMLYNSETDMEWARENCADGKIEVTEIPELAETPSLEARIEALEISMLEMLGVSV